MLGGVTVPGCVQSQQTVVRQPAAELARRSEPTAGHRHMPTFYQIGRAKGATTEQLASGTAVDIAGLGLGEARLQPRGCGVPNDFADISERSKFPSLRKRGQREVSDSTWGDPPVIPSSKGGTRRLAVVKELRETAKHKTWGTAPWMWLFDLELDARYTQRRRGLPMSLAASDRCMAARPLRKFLAGGNV